MGLTTISHTGTMLRWWKLSSTLISRMDVTGKPSRSFSILIIFRATSLPVFFSRAWCKCRNDRCKEWCSGKLPGNPTLSQQTRNKVSYVREHCCKHRIPLPSLVLSLLPAYLLSSQRCI